MLEMVAHKNISTSQNNTLLLSKNIFNQENHAILSFVLFDLASETDISTGGNENGNRFCLASRSGFMRRRVSLLAFNFYKK